MKIFYKDKNFRSKAKSIISQANTIIAEYSAQGYDLTLRQLYYQFVSRDLISNQQREYTRLSKVISDARLAGLIDWSAIVDRTRRLNTLSHFDSVADVLKAAKYSYRIDKWERQDHYIQVWIEKDALTGVISGICNEWDIPYIAVRGYNSQSTMHSMAMMLQGAVSDGKRAVILHLGDHDLSGIDMTRDNQDRLDMFVHSSFADVKRLALNYDQVERYNPPPNPIKMTDSRAGMYVLDYGYDSWELDALEPNIISRLIEDEIKAMVDMSIWNEDIEREEEDKERVNEYINIELTKTE